MGGLMAPRERIRRVLRKHGSLTMRQIVMHTGLAAPDVRHRVWDMRKSGMLGRQGKYYLILREPTLRRAAPKPLREPKPRGLSGERNPSSKLTSEQVRAIRVSTEKGAVIAARYGINQSHVSKIQRHLLWRAA